MQPTTESSDSPPEPLLGLSAAARLAGLSANAIWRAGKRGEIATEVIAERTLYDRLSVERYGERRGAEKRTARPAAASAAG